MAKQAPAYQHESYWEKFKAIAEHAGSPEEVESKISSLISKIPDDHEQVALYRFAIRGLMFREWRPTAQTKSLDSTLLLAERAIAKALDLKEIDEANIICYNMSSNLAVCWKDGFVRGTQHFEIGLAYARRALAYRRQLEKGPIPFSIAHWAEGIHLFALKKYAEAETAFRTSLHYAVKSASAENRPVDISSFTPFFVLIEHGYIALAQLAQGSEFARQTFDSVVASFEAMKEISEEAKADAEIGLDQLLAVRALIPT